MKKQGFGMWLSLVAIIAAVVAFVVYGQAIVAGENLQIASGSEVFYDVSADYYESMVNTVGTYSIVAIVLLGVAIVLGQFQNKVFSIITSIVRIVAPVILMVAFLNFLNGSFTGIGWTFFSNEELVIYEEATAVGNQVIIGLVAFAVAAVVAIFSAFFAITKKVKVEE